jgi:tyrosyl-tRNA synthetase
MDAKEKFNLIKQNTEEILTEENLKQLLENDTSLNHYIGFEISGKIHIGTGLMCMLKIKDFMNAGVKCSVFLADWHSWINNKLGGDLKIIQKIAVRYFKEGLKASLECVGGNSSKVKFMLGSDLYNNNNEFWLTVIDISKNTTLSRMQRSITILGRKEEGNIDFAKLIYPPMQVADIFVQGINMPQAGLDQRKAQVIARDVAEKLTFKPLKDINNKTIKPCAVHHHLILGLGHPPEWPIKTENKQDLWATLKMSKSKPDTCIFIHDSEEEIKRKIKKAFCPEGETEFNPILDWCKSIIFPIQNKFEIIRPEKFGGNKTYQTYNELENDFRNKKVHPLDLKTATSNSLISILEPARKHFAKPEIKEMLDEMEKLLITR